MENKINIAELLKDCPKGMELDCSMWNNVVFDHIDTTSNYPIYIKKMGGELEYLTEGGHFNFDCDAKCVIFPKGKTTWNEFVPLCEFKDGDVVATTEGLWIGITAGGEKGKFIPTYCVIQYDGKFEAYLNRKESWTFNRLATEEEKQRLFDTIKANGYKWNLENKTLEKLVEPKFKIGDRVRNKNYKDYIYDIHDITDKGYRAKEINADSPILILFGPQEDNYELIPNKFDVSTLKPFESKVLMRSSNAMKWTAAFYSHKEGEYFAGCGLYCKQCIPYEGNEYLLGKTEDCDEYFKTW